MYIVVTIIMILRNEFIKKKKLIKTDYVEFFIVVLKCIY